MSCQSAKFSCAESRDLERIIPTCRAHSSFFFWRKKIQTKRFSGVSSRCATALSTHRKSNFIATRHCCNPNRGRTQFNIRSKWPARLISKKGEKKGIPKFFLVSSRFCRKKKKLFLRRWRRRWASGSHRSPVMLGTRTEQVCFFLIQIFELNFLSRFLPQQDNFVIRHSKKI